jgi:hypothetical protein
VTWLLVMVLEMSVVMAFGFVLGRVWPLVDVPSVWMADYEAEMGDFRPPPIGPIPTSCATTTGERLYYPPAMPGTKTYGRLAGSPTQVRGSSA